MYLKGVSHVFYYFILLGAISLAFKDIVSEREKRFELLERRKKQQTQTLSSSTCLSLHTKQTNQKKKGVFFFINIFFPAGILGQYIKFPQKEALELFT